MIIYISQIIISDIRPIIINQYKFYLGEMKCNNINIHTLSPLLYCGFIFLHKLFSPCPYSTIMKKIRLYHNINLSLISFIMMIGITYSTYYSNKFQSFNSLLCTPYNTNDSILILTFLGFLYSKYLEWIDTTFLYFGNKRITWLQYSHHMSTALLTYYNLDSSLMFVPLFLNTIVHIPMYWYFAFPRGVLFKFRSIITQMQIIQHIICLLVLFYSYLFFDDCRQNPVGIIMGLFLYSMYLIFFILFYIDKYLSKKINKED